MSCAQCGNMLIEGARFCPHCGAATPAVDSATPAAVASAAVTDQPEEAVEAEEESPQIVFSLPPDSGPPRLMPSEVPSTRAPAEPVPAAMPEAQPQAGAAAPSCPRCQFAIPAGRKFCTNCGYNLEAPAAAPVPIPVTAQGATPAAQNPAPKAGAGPALAPLQMAAVAGFAAAILATFLAWATFDGDSVNLWNTDGGGRYQIADWAGDAQPIDAVLVLVIALAGGYLVAAPLIGGSAPRIPFGAAICGAAIAAIAIANYSYLDDFSDFGLGIGIGLYLTVVAGAAAAISTFILEQQRLTPAPRPPS